MVRNLEIAEGFVVFGGKLRASWTFCGAVPDGRDKWGMVDMQELFLVGLLREMAGELDLCSFLLISGRYQLAQPSNQKLRGQNLSPSP
jgi:hypothetical protein